MKTILALLISLNAFAADYSKPSFMYVYDYDNVVTGTLGEREKMLTFAKANNITDIYLSGGRYFEYPSKQPALTEFITLAKNTYGMNTALVLGAYEWALLANHPKAIDITNKAVAYIKTLTIKPVALQYDVEPHALDGWNSNLQSYSNQYLDMISKIMAVTKPASVHTQFTTSNFYGGKMITRNGVTKPLSQFVIDASDSIVIMNYRDNVAYTKVVSGPAKQTFSNLVLGTSSSHNVTDDIAYATAKKKKVYEAFNTNCKSSIDFDVTESQCNLVLKLDKAAYQTYGSSCNSYFDYKASSFCEQGKSAMLNVGKLLNTTYTSKYSGYNGWGVFAYKYFSELKP